MIDPLAVGGYGAALLQSALALLVVCILAWIVLRWGSKGAIHSRWGSAGNRGGRIEVIERTSLDAGRSLYLIRIGERVLLLGSGESGAPSILSEFAEGDLPPIPEASASGPWTRLLSRRRP